jgi:zinc/manganese transport system permease protein
MEVFSFLVYPFLACILLILIHVYFGVHILERGIIFLDLSMAQFIALGISLSFFMGYEGSEKYIYAIFFAVTGAAIFSLSRHISKFVNIEAFIGVFYIFSLAASMLLLDRTPHGFEELKSILNGSILWVSAGDVVKMSLLYSAIGILHLVFRKRFFALTYEKRGGYCWEFLFFLSFALVLVSSVSTAGILQVFSFLIIPALIGRLCAKKVFHALLISWVVGIWASLFGLFASYKMDMPAAPLFIAFLSAVFFLILIFKAWRGNWRGGSQ